MSNLSIWRANRGCTNPAVNWGLTVQSPACRGRITALDHGSGRSQWRNYQAIEQKLAYLRYILSATGRMKEEEQEEAVISGVGAEM